MNHEQPPHPGPEHQGQPDHEAVTSGPEVEPEARPRIWVGSWHDYNNGVLHGDWIAADREEAEVWSEIHAMLGRSPTAAATGNVAEDWGIFDFENFGPLRLGEQESVGWVTRVARGISEHGLAFAAWADVIQEEAALDGFADVYVGHYAGIEDYAEQLVNDAGYDQQLGRVVPESMRAYVRFDCAALARDMQLGGDIQVVPASGGGVWVFYGNV